MEKKSYKNIIISGILGNSLECFIQQPIYGYKNLKQINAKLERFNHLYRGVLGNVFTQSTLVISQITGYKYFIEKYECNNLHKLIISGGLGFISGSLFSPLELWSIRKQQKLSFFHNRNIYKGSLSMGMREMCFSAGLLTIMPLMNKWLETIYGSSNNIVASLIAGSISGFLSHPFDTIKSYEQSQITDKYKKIKYNPLDRNLYKGLSFRMIRISGSYFILDYFNNSFLNK